MWNWNSYNELYHHGILGQKWGKRNGPPYPLGSSDHSASERKAGWRKSLEDHRTYNRPNYNQKQINSKLSKDIYTNDVVRTIKKYIQKEDKEMLYDTLSKMLKDDHKYFDKYQPDYRKQTADVAKRMTGSENFDDYIAIYIELEYEREHSNK